MTVTPFLIYEDELFKEERKPQKHSDHEEKD